jgi:hypothetical protein
VHGATLLLAYSARDRSLRELRAHFGRGGRHLPRRAPIRTLVLGGSDHAVNPRAMQDEIIAAIEDDLLRYHIRDHPAVPARNSAYASPINSA